MVEATASPMRSDSVNAAAKLNTNDSTTSLMYVLNSKNARACCLSLTTVGHDHRTSLSSPSQHKCISIVATTVSINPNWFTTKLPDCMLLS